MIEGLVVIVLWLIAEFLMVACGCNKRSRYSRRRRNNSRWGVPEMALFAVLDGEATHKREVIEKEYVEKMPTTLQDDARYY